MMEKLYKFDAFKIAGKDFLMITLSFSKEVKVITYEILGDKGTHIEKKIKGCLTQNYITEQIMDVDETLVFKYKLDDMDVGFSFINYEELMDNVENEDDIMSNTYSVDKNIHLRIDMIKKEKDTDSSSIESLELEPGECLADCLNGMEDGDDEMEHDDNDYDMDELAMMGFDVESGEIIDDDGDGNLYKPVSDEEDMEGSIFHMEDGVDITDIEEIGDVKEGDSDTPPGWNIMRPEPIKIDDSKKVLPELKTHRETDDETDKKIETDVDNETDKSVKNIEIDDADI
jgi:hypothetical protein